jgi:hypothetical protein
VVEVLSSMAGDHVEQDEARPTRASRQVSPDDVEAMACCHQVGDLVGVAEDDDGADAALGRAEGSVPLASG